MAEVRSITIEIIDGSGGGEDDEDKKAKKKKKEEEKLKEKQKNALKKFGQEALAMLTNAAEQSLQRHFTLTENYMSQNIYSNAKKTISLVTQGATSIASMAKIGGVFGPVGAVGGAIVGAVSFGVNTFIDYQTRMSSYYQSLNAGNYQSDFSQVRAGLVDGSRGTEN